MAEGSEENMAAWLIAVRTIRIRPYCLPSLGMSKTVKLGPHDVKVRMKAVGICGSDVHHFKIPERYPDDFCDCIQNMRVANFVLDKPMVIGHESAGIVEEVGIQVKNLVVGDRVALEPGICCARCNYCISGSYNLCPEMKFFGSPQRSPPTNGSLAKMVVHPARLCFKLPDNVSLEEGAMCEPLSVGVHACRRANISPDTKVLIMGAGPIGLVTMLAARAFGAPNVIMADVDDQRLTFAKNLGADATIQVSTNTQDANEEITEINKAMGGSPDVSFDCVGVEKTMTTALNATKSGGKVCLVGLGQSSTMHIPLIPAAAREVDIIGIFRYRNTWPICIELLRTGKIDVKPLITHRYKFNQQDLEEAFETSSRGGNAIKVMFNL